MDLGSFTSGLLTGLREGVEAALIVSIILAYLARTGNHRYFGWIWLGTGVAVLFSLFAGLALYLTVGGLEEPYEQIFEGLTMLLAASVVTWMLFWMRRQAASVKGELQAALDRALSQGTVL
ncbi:MAG: FTR1 family protein, partial [Chloroflexi bacterium]|nr:FTR1 family protein [Chloroflexota bacterium]